MAVSTLGWASLRLTFGIGQMVMAVVTAVFLVRDGIAPLPMGCFVVTGASSAIGVLLFGSRERRTTLSQRRTASAGEEAAPRAPSLPMAPPARFPGGPHFSHPPSSSRSLRCRLRSLRRCWAITRTILYIHAELGLDVAGKTLWFGQVHRLR